MTDAVEQFKTRRERELDAKREVMANRLHTLADQVLKGEVTGFAIVTVDASGRRPTAEWQGICGADSLGHGIGCLFHRYFRTHGSN